MIGGGNHVVVQSMTDTDTADVAATVAQGPVRIDNTHTVATSFPGFVHCLSGLGIEISRDGERPAP